MFQRVEHNPAAPSSARPGCGPGALTAGREQNVTLPRPVPVHLLYWTVWVDDEGLLQFRDDIYERDQPVLRELRENPPS
jgi:murein L,D-transpeptidase YcbB/YkuD